MCSNSGSDDVVKKFSLWKNKKKHKKLLYVIIWLINSVFFHKPLNKEELHLFLPLFKQCQTDSSVSINSPTGQHMSSFWFYSLPKKEKNISQVTQKCIAWEKNLFLTFFLTFGKLVASIIVHKKKKTFYLSISCCCCMPSFLSDQNKIIHSYHLGFINSYNHTCATLVKSRYIVI